MRFAVSTPPFAEPAALVELGVAVERAGWDAFFLWDHMVVDRRGVEIVDPWVALGAIEHTISYVDVGPWRTRVLQAGPADGEPLILMAGTGGHLEAYAARVQCK